MIESGHGIAEPMVPRRLLVVDAIPVLGTGKTDYPGGKGWLRKRWRDGMRRNERRSNQAVDDSQSSMAGTSPVIDDKRGELTGHEA
ncbi:MAG: hypothetical protein WCC64_23140 [Aliidongia sp.]